MVHATVTLLKVVKDYTKQLLDKLGQEKVNKDELVELKNRQIEELLKIKCSDRIHKIDNYINDVINGLKFLGFNVLRIDAELEYKGVINVSSGLLHGIFEVGLAWDYLYDVPVIPGSAVKGAMRNVAISRCLRATEKEKCLEYVFRLFGWIEFPSRQELSNLGNFLNLDISKLRRLARNVYGVGSIQVFDAYPIGCNRDSLLEPDILTPHYFSGGKVVEDEYEVQPNPIPHVVIKEGTTFSFVASFDNNALNILEKYANLIFGVKINAVNKADVGLIMLASLLNAALKTGIGARTRRGYSIFKIKDIKSYGQKGVTSW